MGEGSAVFSVFFLFLTSFHWKVSKMEIFPAGGSFPSSTCNNSSQVSHNAWQGRQIPEPALTTSQGVHQPEAGSEPGTVIWVADVVCGCLSCCAKCLPPWRVWFGFLSGPAVIGQHSKLTGVGEATAPKTNLPHHSTNGCKVRSLGLHLCPQVHLGQLLPSARFPSK